MDADILCHNQDPEIQERLSLAQNQAVAESQAAADRDDAAEAFSASERAAATKKFASLAPRRTRDMAIPTDEASSTIFSYQVTA